MEKFAPFCTTRRRPGDTGRGRPNPGYGAAGGDRRAAAGRPGTRLAPRPVRMEELRVPKRRVAAEALLPGGRRLRIALFLAEAASAHAGPERPADLLNGGSDFVPAFDEDAQVMTFLNRAGLAVVRVDGALEADGAEALGLPIEQEVEVLLQSGERLAGIVSYLRPPERSRLVDFLSEPTPFFPLVEKDALALVNKRHVARVALKRP